MKRILICLLICLALPFSIRAGEVFDFETKQDTNTSMVKGIPYSVSDQADGITPIVPIGENLRVRTVSGEWVHLGPTPIVPIGARGGIVKREQVYRDTLCYNEIVERCDTAWKWEIRFDIFNFGDNLGGNVFWSGPSPCTTNVYRVQVIDSIHCYTDSIWVNKN